jgi:hypothetical protein
MKRLFNLLMLLIPLISYAQKSADPCCGIIKLQSPDGVIIRNNATGRTFLIKADALDFGNLKVGDQVSADFGSSRVTGIKGVERNYSISQMNPADPCCTVTSIKPYPAAPCCSMVGLKNNTTNEAFDVRVDKAVSSQLSQGMSVYRLETSGGTNIGPVDGDKLGPVDGDKFGPVDGYAGFVVGTGNNAMHYTYPIRGMKSTASANNSPAADNGYSSIIAHCEIRNNEHATIIINGKAVASYTHGSFDFDLAHYLHSGTNNITLSFESGSYSKINVIGKFPDETKGNIIYSFAPKKDALSGTYELTYSPVTK